MWTKEEVKAYNPYRYDALNILYENADIPNTKPWKRAVYLVEKYFGDGHETFKWDIKQKANKSKVAMLHLLEDLVVENFL